MPLVKIIIMEKRFAQKDELGILDAAQEVKYNPLSYLKFDTSRGIYANPMSRRIFPAAKDPSNYPIKNLFKI